MYSIAEDDGYWDEYQAAKQERDEARAQLAVLASQVEANRARYEDARRERDEALAALAGCVRYQSMRTHCDEIPYHAAWGEARRLLAEHDGATTHTEALRNALTTLLATAYRLAGDDDDWEDDDGHIAIQQGLAEAREALGIPQPEGRPRPHGF